MTSVLQDSDNQVGEKRRSPWRVAAFSAVAGILLAVLWSPELVDKVIAEGLAGPVFGADIAEMSIDGSGLAIAFAFVTGMAGMFTACNVAVFSALAPLSAQDTSARARLAGLVRPIAWLLLGAVSVAGLYGAIGVYVGDRSGQLSDAHIGSLSLRALQAGIVFGLIGIVMVWRGLAYLRPSWNPLRDVFARRPRAELVFLGTLIGAFLIGRPFPPFRNLYSYAASTDNPFLGFSTFALQSIGNIVGVVVLFVLVTLLTRGRFQTWLTSRPGRTARFSAGAFILVGTFFIFYWGVKTGARADLLWWPELPYNS